MDSATAVPFEGLDLPALSSRSPLTYRHTTHGLQKQELSRTDSAAIRESEELAGGQEQRDAEVAQQERRETQAADRLGHLFSEPPKRQVAPLQLGEANGAVKADSGSPHIATTSIMPSLGGWPANGVLPTPPGGAGPGGAQPKKRRRVVKKDPNKPTPKPWDEAEIKRLKDMVHKEGPGNWDSKALRLGSVRPHAARLLCRNETLSLLCLRRAERRRRCIPAGCGTRGVSSIGRGRAAAATGQPTR